MLEYKEFPPAAPLRKYVQCYFTFQLKERVDFSGMKYPNGQIEIGFNLGDSLFTSQVGQRKQADPLVELLGQLSRPMLIKSPGNTFMLGIRFYSYTACYFLDSPLDAFNNHIIDLRDVIGVKMKTLYEQLLNEPDLNNRIGILDNYLLGRIAHTSENNKLVLLGHIINDLRHNPGKSIERIADQYKVSPRFMRRYFLRYVGISPKLYGRIARFQQGLQIMNGNIDSLTDLSYRLGYSDQSHFIRDFKAFSDVTPSDYLAQIPVIK